VSATVQVRVTVGRQQVLVEGPDDADVVVTVAKPDLGADPSVLFMRGKLKATGTTGNLLGALADGRVGDALNRLASQL
jgi:hypothetical protein